MAIKHIKKILFDKLGQKNNFLIKRILRNNNPNSYGPPIDNFITSSNNSIPLYNNYRYQLTGKVTYIGDLELLRSLYEKRIISKEESEEYLNAIGSRTINISLKEIGSLTLKIAKNHRDKVNITGSKVSLKINESLHKEKINSFASSIKSLLDYIEANSKLTISPKSYPEVLEVGFTSGGHSAFAWEKNGFAVECIDNAYDDVTELPNLHNEIKNLTNSNVNFSFQDITTTKFLNNSIDIIYSTSVLEHITDINKAFKEMHRIVKPSGFIIHSYNPFFTANGGHSWGCLDCPWGHVRLNKSDHLKYLKEKRPHEYEIAKDWVDKTLNRISISEMKQHLKNNNFDLILWSEFREKDEILNDLTYEIYKECISIYPDIELRDLITRDILLVAKPIK